MALLKIGDFDSNYRDSFNGDEIKGYGIYSQNEEKIGTVSDILVDEEGHFRYFIVDLGFWIFGKKVLLPVGRSRIDYGAQRVYATGLTREQADHLPEFTEDLAIDYDYEEQVRGVYRAPATGAPVSTGMNAAVPVDTSASLEASAPLEADYTTSTTGDFASAATPSYANYDRDTYKYHQEPSLYAMNEQDHQNLKLYEERLVANKRRVKTGEVAIGKHVETETARVSVPLEKERVVIERVTPQDAGRAVAPGEVNFREGEVAHVDIYEETPDIRKEAFVREEVRISKEVEQETVQAQETIRREELDIDTDGRIIDNKGGNLPNNRI